MLDKFVRDAFHHDVLISEYSDSDTLVLDEFSLKNGSCRADIAVLNGKMVGYEIKTDRDNLRRLHLQIIAYNEVFDKIFLIVGPKLLANATKIIPEWWGIFEVIVKCHDSIEFKLIRKPKKNIGKNKMGILQLLWKDEIIELLNLDKQIKVTQRVTKKRLYEIAEANFSSEALATHALKTLKSREGWRKGRTVLFENDDCYLPISK